jgi:hypothetical protein
LPVSLSVKEAPIVDGISGRVVVVVLSEMVAAWLIWRLWRSSEHIYLKIGLSLLAPIPGLGPFLILWISKFPDVQPLAMQDRYRNSTDVTDRWRHVWEEKDPSKREKLWREMMGVDKNENL